MAKNGPKTSAEKLAKILEEESKQEQVQPEEKLVETEIKLSENPELAEVMKQEGMITEEEIAADKVTIQYNENETLEEGQKTEETAPVEETKAPEAPVQIQEEVIEELTTSHGPLDDILSEIAEMQEEEVKTTEEIAQEYQMTISEENLPPVILNGEAFYIVDGQYMPEVPALIEFQKRKILREFKKYKQLLAKLKK